MNRTRRPMDERVRKKVNKEIKSGEKQYIARKIATARTDTLTADEEVKKYPKKIRKTDQSLLASLKKNFAIKKKKISARHSKRTTPGSVEGQPSAPASVHPEGKRWEKTLQLQNNAGRKALSAKLLKKK
jgi:hypothetical protein